MEKKICQNCKNEFVIEQEDFNFYEKMKVPPPTFCPECRQQLRLLYRNFKTLYKRPSSKSGKMIVSMYNPGVSFPVYDIGEWWVDDWDPISFGKDIDWGRSFFKQLLELFNSVPHMSMMNTKSENCEYSNMVINGKNCYLVFGSIDDENCDYGHIVWNSKDSIDNLYIFKCEACYECVDCLGCNALLYSQECESCAESIGLFDCKGCINCIGCVGLINKSYNIFNKQVSKEEYEIFLKYNSISEIANLKKIISKVEELRKTIPQRFFYGYRNSNVSGNHIYNAHNLHNSFDIKEGENSKFCYTIRKAIDSYDSSFSADLSECYQVLNCGGSNKIIGSHNIIDSHDVFYSDLCFNCDNIFGCYGLRKKSYCILNKQYSKEEYIELVPKLITLTINNNEWGNFFSKELSPFSYNESIVNEYMPLSRDMALFLGFRWQNEIPSTIGKETIKIEDIPADPENYNDSLKNEIIACKTCKRNFKLISREIAFYKKKKLSIPYNCFNCRHELRMKKRNIRTLFDAFCVKCNLKIKTSYKTEDQKKYIIYCDDCYKKEVY